jgi:hypothetical protein
VAVPRGDFFASAFFMAMGWPGEVGPGMGCWAKLCPGPPATTCVGELPRELGLTFFGPDLATKASFFHCVQPYGEFLDGVQHGEGERGRVQRAKVIDGSYLIEDRRDPFHHLRHGLLSLLRDQTHVLSIIPLVVADPSATMPPA